LRNILLIVIDTLRPDHLGCYGYDRDTSPHLDRLAARGALLDACWSASNFTAPAFTSLFTGEYPSRHGVFDFTTKAASSPLKSCLDAHGYRTGGVVTFRFFQNLLQNIWGEIEAVTDTRSFDYSKDLPRAVTAGASEWLRRHGSAGPFCLFVHYDGPHMPYRLPDEYARIFDLVAESEVDAEFRAAVFPQEHERLQSRHHKEGDVKRLFELLEAVNRKLRRIEPATLTWLINKYDASIRYNDEAVGQLLQNLSDQGLAEDTVIAVLSDHGEEFLDHGQISHGHIHLYEEVIRTAGIVVSPGIPGGRRLSRPVSHVGVLPTLLRLAGIPELPANAAAADFSRQLISSPGDHSSAGNSRAGSKDATRIDRQGETADLDPIFCVSKFKIAVRSGQWKWIQPLPSSHLPRVARWKLWLKMLLLRELKNELYDLRNDPTESVNLTRDKHRVQCMAALVKDHLRASRGASLVGGTAADLAAAERARIEQEMRDLGYM